MMMDDPGSAIFEADPSDEWKLSFTIPDLREEGGRRTLMWFRCFEPDKLLSVAVWLGERQHLWAEWRAIAESQDGAALSRHLTVAAEADALTDADGERYLFEACSGATIAICDDGSEIEILVRLPTRTLGMIVHDFGDADVRDAFMTWMAEDEEAPGCVELALFALLEGRTALARQLDTLAATLAASDAPTIH